MFSVYTESFGLTEIFTVRPEVFNHGMYPSLLRQRCLTLNRMSSKSTSDS